MRRLWLATLTTLLLATAAAGAEARAVKLLIITGDEVPAHKWRETSPLLKGLLTPAGPHPDATETPPPGLPPPEPGPYHALPPQQPDPPPGTSPPRTWPGTTPSC